MSGLPIGVNTYSYLWRLSAHDTLVHLADQGYTAFEVMANPPHLWPAQLDAAARRETGRLLAERGLRIVSLNPPSLDQNLVSPVPEMRAYTVAMFRELLELANAWEVAYVVTVPGRLHPLLAPPRESVRDWLRAGLEALIPHAERAGVRLALENIPMAALPRAADLGEMLDELDSEALCVCYDVANAEFIGEAPDEGLFQVRRRLALVHVSDTGRTVWRHDPVGRGQVRFDRVASALREIGYGGTTMMEIISPQPDADLAESHHKLAALGWAPPAA